MSIDYSTSVFVGFKVEENSIFDTRHEESKSCIHIMDEDSSIKFCPTCGVKVEVLKYTERKFKLELQEILKNVQYYDLKLWTKQFNKHQIILYHLFESSNNKTPYVVGVLLKNVDPKCEETDAYFCGKLNDLPKETELAEFLTENSIPFEKETFGIYLLNQTF